MLECTNCGATGEANFSANFFGEMVCELCGTQSFLEARNETQDMEDTTMDMTRISSMKETRRKKSRKRNRTSDIKTEGDELDSSPKPKLTLLNCLMATQTILTYQVQSLMDNIEEGAFPADYPFVVQELWFLLLDMWEVKGARPLLRSFTEFYLPVKYEDKDIDATVASELMEQWDLEQQQAAEGLMMSQTNPDGSSDDDECDDNADKAPPSPPPSVEMKPRKKRGLKLSGNRPLLRKDNTAEYSRTLDRFSLLDLLGLLVLAARVLNMGLMPSDFAYWVTTGAIPYHNLFSVCSPSLQEAISDVQLFFHSNLLRNRISAARIAYHAHYLQHHLELSLPPLNVSLVAHTICTNLGFPAEVFRHFQWIMALFNTKGELPEKALWDKKTKRFYTHNPYNRKIDIYTSVSIVAHLAVAVRMCANWHEWIYERVGPRQRHVPPYTEDDAQGMPRRELDAFVAFCESALVGGKKRDIRIPPHFEEHVHDLKYKFGALRDLVMDNAKNYFEGQSLIAYPAIHEHGVCVERDDDIEERIAELKKQNRERKGPAMNNDVSDGDAIDHSENVYFYPRYNASHNQGAMHAAFENVLEVLCEYIDAPIACVIQLTQMLDSRMFELCRILSHHETGLTERFQAKSTAIKQALKEYRQKRVEKMLDPAKQDKRDKPKEPPRDADGNPIKRRRGRPRKVVLPIPSAAPEIKDDQSGSRQEI